MIDSTVLPLFCTDLLGITIRQDGVLLPQLQHSLQQLVSLHLFFLIRVIDDHILHDVDMFRQEL